MTRRCWPLLADENVSRALTEELGRLGFDVATVVELGLAGQSDSTILREATIHGRVVLTHDGDFGRLAIGNREPLTGILFVRPGHVEATRAAATIAGLDVRSEHFQAPFLLVMQFLDESVRVRHRQL